MISLPLLPRHGTRSRMTCHYRCANQCDHPVANPSENPYFRDLVARSLSRRSLLAGGAATGALVVGTGLATSPAHADAVTAAGVEYGQGHGGDGVDRLDFATVPPNSEDKLRVPSGYQQGVVVAWGDPVEESAPAFDFDRQSKRAQERQFGYNNDYVAMLELGGGLFGLGGDEARTAAKLGRDCALLVVNHEYTNDELMFRDWDDPETVDPELHEISMAAHGLAVVQIRRAGRTGRWQLQKSGWRPFNRRITAYSRTRLTGPAAGHVLVRTRADPRGRTILGTFANCSGGTTPWGTTLHGEENFHGYFDVSGSVGASHHEAFERYGVPTEQTTGRGWSRVDERFDLTKNPNEANRFGWVVELDPFNPWAPPRKHSMLGRLKHEGATTALSKDRHAVVYMGDDEAFDYVYKFVSAEKYRPGHRAHNLRLLESGTLYVAKYAGEGTEDGEHDGTGSWIPLTSDTESFVDGFSVAEVLVHTRLAADKVGATKMDRPEDFERNPKSGSLYLACTNNTDREETDGANPRPANKDGHIIEMDEAGNDAGAVRFAWRLLLVCGDPKDESTYFAGFDKSKVSPISCPDNVAFDGSGNLWISTDGNTLGGNDGLFALPLSGPERGYVRQFLTVPLGAETCGPVISSDQRTVLVAVQHPGESDDASPENPASHWPYGGQPRPAIACVWKD